MPPIVVIAELKAANKDARQTLLRELTKVGQFSKANEPGVTRWAIFLPRDAGNDTALYAIEEYVDQSAFEQHMACKAVSDLIAFFTANGNLFGGETTITTSETQSRFAKSELSTAKDPFISYTRVEGKSDEASNFGNENTAGILALSVAKDKAKADTMHAVAIYAGEQALRKNAQADSVSLKFATGFLVKAESGSKL